MVSASCEATTTTCPHCRFPTRLMRCGKYLHHDDEHIFPTGYGHLPPFGDGSCPSERQMAIMDERRNSPMPVEGPSIPITCLVEREYYHALVHQAQLENELVRNIASQILNSTLREMIKNHDLGDDEEEEND